MTSYSQEHKHDGVLDRLKTNTNKLNNWDKAIGERLDSNKQAILGRFIEEAGCLPSEAELIMKHVAGGLVVQLRKKAK